MTSLREVMDDAAYAAVTALPDRPDAAQAATAAARRRRRVRALGAGGLLVVAVLLAYALVPAATSLVRRPVPPATPPGVSDVLPGTLGAPPPWLPDLSQTPVGRVGLVVSDSNGPYVVSADGATEARLPGAGWLSVQVGPLVSSDGSVASWPVGSDFCAGLPGRLGWYEAGSGQVRYVDLAAGDALGGAVQQVMVSPDGSEIFAQVILRSPSEGCSGTQQMFLVDSSSGAVRPLVLAADLLAYTPLAWDADSRSITFLANDAAWVGGPNHAVRCDLTGRVLARLTISSVQQPQGVVVGLPGPASAPPGSGGTRAYWALRGTPDLRVAVWQVGLSAGVDNKSTSYRTDFASIGPNATYLGRRQGADALSAMPVGSTPDPQAVVLAARPGAPTTVLVQGADGDQVLAAATSVIADARIGGAAPDGPPWWSPTAIGWALRTYWPWLLALALLGVLAAWAWPRVRSRQVSVGSRPTGA